MLGGKSWDYWTQQYEKSHQNPFNQLCHFIGIPMIVLSLVLLLFVIFNQGLWRISVLLFIVGWILQFLGHFIEGTKPEFMNDPRFLLVGFRWWLKKMFR